MGPKKKKSKSKDGKSKGKGKGKGKDAAKAKGKEAKETPARRKSPTKSSKIQVEQEQLPEIISDTIVEYLHEVEADSPIDLEWSSFFKIRASSIEWTNWDTVPNTLTLRNSAYNVLLTGTWPTGMTPSVTKGPLNSKYDFAQGHFHWGPDSNTGSDHAVGGFTLPFEIHLVFYKASSGSLAEAKKEEDGVVTFCYLYKIGDFDNLMIQPVTDNIKEVTYAYTEKHLDPVPMSALFPPITDDFIAYLGHMKYKTVHGVTFVISRDTHFISEHQLSGFRNLKDRHENPMILNAREVVSYGGRYVFVMNPKNTNVTSVLVTSGPARGSLRSSTATTKSSGSRKSRKSIKKGRKGSKKGSRKGSKSSKGGKSEGEELRKGSIKSRKRASKKSKKSKKSKSSKKSKKSKGGAKKKPSKKPKSKK